MKPPSCSMKWTCTRTRTRQIPQKCMMNWCSSGTDSVSWPKGARGLKWIAGLRFSDGNGQYSLECIKCGRESFDPTCLELIRQKAQKIERNRRIETWRL